ncbi:Arc family DNA-binding protein [Massilia soli]|uniref:Arc family DNA-binding protein n=1 Tax=Massilia soli TaxID=2792854 RepID=A0ABS7SRC8_9BURK|nr:Arc family DNA-binding protein [Massilia soli]MBZ2208507.1 Arc family DNA-binding protein [Massilia soli]
MALQNSEQQVADKEQFILRLPGGMRNRIKEMAIANRRSMNGELLMMIEKCLAEEEAAEMQ